MRMWRCMDIFYLNGVWSFNLNLKVAEQKKVAALAVCVLIHIVEAISHVFQFIPYLVGHG